CAAGAAVGCAAAGAAVGCAAGPPPQALSAMLIATNAIVRNLFFPRCGVLPPIGRSFLPLNRTGSPEEIRNKGNSCNLGARQPNDVALADPDSVWCFGCRV